MELPVYLDNASTTPLDPRVADAMVRCLQSSDGFGNPSTDTHALGRKARAQVETARDQVAALINAACGDIIWTSGATSRAASITRAVRSPRGVRAGTSGDSARMRERR